MHAELERQVDRVRKCESWERVVAEAAPCDHIVQLYQDQDSLNCAACRFVGAGLANGEGIILVSTLTHWNAFRPGLEAEGLDVPAARERGQLSVVDAGELLPRLDSALRWLILSASPPSFGRMGSPVRRA